MKKFLIMGAATLTLVTTMAALAACEVEPQHVSADSRVHQQQEQVQSSLEARIGQPRITRGTEMALVNMIYEMRDDPNLQTYSYTRDLNGRLHCIGHSMGYGIPYGLQRSNPQKLVRADLGQYYGQTVIAQAEPNGLYPPSAANGTWVMVVVDGKPRPQYVENDVEVYTAMVPGAANSEGFGCTD